MKMLISSFLMVLLDEELVDKLLISFYFVSEKMC